MSMNDYAPIRKYIKQYQLQRTVVLAEVLTDGFVWFFKGLDNVSARIAGALSRKPGQAKTAAQH
jgi:hypothetical protein